MDDLISRQAAIDALDELCDRECEYSKQQRSVMCGACHLGSAFDVIENLPSAQQERKMGKWYYKIIRRNYNDDEYYMCSECGAKIVNPEYKNYCPNCGAEMEVEHETD